MDARFPHPLSNLANEYRMLRARMSADISLIAETQFKENFLRQGYEKSPGMIIPWKRTKLKANTFGKKSKGILIKSARLKRSLRKSYDYNTARVVTDVPYAQIHNEGGKITGTAHVKSFLRKGKRVKSHTRKMNTTMPARPFMMHTKGLEARIENYMDTELMRIWNKA